eukprot:m.140064 g.140064  ORF g.140064 m.140064 type:complete len:305 (+) comp17650_c0_seq5:100-1014(+)
MADVKTKERLSFGALLKKAAKASFRGGIPGAAAMILNVVLLMWLRTAINYQYRHGGSIGNAFSTLYEEGGISRFYQGLGPALLQGPLSRFGDTAANEGIIALLSTSGIPVAIVTILASVTAGLWRIAISPIDMLKTTLQVEGPRGLITLEKKVFKEGISILFSGALGSWAATTVGHYPWFYTYNKLDRVLPKSFGNTRIGKLTRNAFVGLVAGIISDCVSNSIRVVKTVKQTAPTDIGYADAFNQVVKEEGFEGLFLRGLSIKIISNAISSILFTILWKYFMERWQQRSEKKDGEKAEKSGKQS